MFMHNFTRGYQCMEKLLKTNINQRNMDSVETSSYVVNVFITQVSTSRGLREVGNKLCTQAGETETAPNKGKTTIVFLQL